MRESEFDKGFAAGIQVAAQIARLIAAHSKEAATGKWAGAAAALEALADEIGATTMKEVLEPGATVGRVSGAAGDRVADAITMGYTGDACPECKKLTMIRNGTCLKCADCGATTGCS